MPDKLLSALQAKYPTPAAALAALGLDAALLPVSSRYVCAQDSQSVVERSTGRVIDIATFMSTLFAKENKMVQSRLARLAGDADLPSVSGIKGDPKPNLDQDDPTATGPAPSGEDCLQFVRLCMQGL
jgi:hypothetical protein